MLTRLRRRLRLHEEEKNNLYVFWGCWIVYMITGFAKTNYAASVAYIVSNGIFTKSQSGFIASAFYIFYGIGQLFGGMLVDRFSPYKTMTIGVVSAILANLILCFTNNYTVVLIVWSLNGLMQFGIWTGISKIIADDIGPSYRKKASKHISYGIPAGTILSYLASAVLLDRFGWVGAFGTSTLLLALALVVWAIALKRAPLLIAEKEEKEEAEKVKTKKLSVLLSSGIFIALIPGLCITMLNNGAQVWIPTMIMESYSVSHSFASIMTMLIVALGIVGLFLFAPLFNKVKNEMLGRAVVMAAVLIPFCILYFIGKIPFGLAFAMFALSTMIISVQSLLGVRTSNRFHASGLSGTVSGILNTMSSFGIVFSSAGYAFLAENFGWTSVSAAWIALVIIAGVGLLIAAWPWAKFIKR